MTRRRGLGRGLEALIPSGEETGGVESARLVAIAEIRPNPRQPRRDLSELDLDDLTQSIRQHGVLQPLVVTPSMEGGYFLIAGERRLHAARLAGLDAVPVVVRVADERQSLELALVENLQREDLDALEAAEGYRQLAEDFGLSHEEIASRVGKSRATVSNTMRLLRLPPTVRQALVSGKLSEGHARALLALPTAQAQSAAAQTVVKRGLSVRQTEELVQKLTGTRRRTKGRGSRSPEEADVEERLRRALGTKVTLRRGRKGGNLIIHFYSDEELEALIDRLASS
jgi:ParB family chromosome partitioning protein